MEEDAFGGKVRAPWNIWRTRRGRRGLLRSPGIKFTDTMGITAVSQHDFPKQGLMTDKSVCFP